MRASVQVGHERAGKRGRGRPRAFDRSTVVEQAMRLFWERGYEGASFNALTEGMGLSASSLLNAFGSKEALFREAMRYYSEGPTAWYAAVLAAPGTARNAFETLVAEIAAGFTGPGFPAGCMVSMAAMQVGPELAPIRTFATQARRASQQALVDRIRRGIADGDVPADTDAAALGAYFGAVFRGMAVQARDGASRSELLSVGAHAMRAWPAACGSGAEQAGRHGVKRAV